MGSPNNLLNSEQLVKKEEHIQEVDEKTKVYIVELAKSLVRANEDAGVDHIVDAVSLFPGFESIQRATLKKIIREDVINNE